jgi:hypothetical protein
MVAENWADKRLARSALIAWYQLISEEPVDTNRISTFHLPELGSLVLTQYKA